MSLPLGVTMIAPGFWDYPYISEDFDLPQRKCTGPWCPSIAVPLWWDLLGLRIKDEASWVVSHCWWLFFGHADREGPKLRSSSAFSDNFHPTLTRVCFFPALPLVADCSSSIISLCLPMYSLLASRNKVLLLLFIWRVPSPGTSLLIRVLPSVLSLPVVVCTCTLHGGLTDLDLTGPLPYSSMHMYTHACASMESKKWENWTIGENHGPWIRLEATALVHWKCHFYKCLYSSAPAVAGDLSSLPCLKFSTESQLSSLEFLSSLKGLTLVEKILEAKSLWCHSCPSELKQHKLCIHVAPFLWLLSMCHPPYYPFSSMLNSLVLSSLPQALICHCHMG